MGRGSLDVMCVGEGTHAQIADRKNSQFYASVYVNVTRIGCGPFRCMNLYAQRKHPNIPKNPCFICFSL